jgi:hypothetical protein
MLRAIGFKQRIVFFSIQLKQLRIVYLEGLGLKMQNWRLGFVLIVLMVCLGNGRLLNL